MHTHAEIIAIGDELTLGQRVDTNSAWIAGQLAERGVHAHFHTTVDDDLDRLTDALVRAIGRAPLVVMTGGLGPTADDLTRAALAAATDDALVEDAAALEALMAWFAGRSAAMPEGNRVQALRPSRGRCLANAHGTAPGLHVVADRTDVFALPGPPIEMRPMFDGEVVPRLRPSSDVRTRVLATVGMGESSVAELLGELMDRDRNPLTGTTASGGVVSVRMREERAIGESGEGRGASELDALEREARARLGAIVFTPAGGTGEESLASVVIGLMRARGETVAVAESCTGGGLGAVITAEAGASDVFVGGAITYSNEVKSAVLGVDAEVIERVGAVSSEVARAMAEGARARFGATHALAITGVAGPGGGTKAKPVGTVWIGLASAGAETDTRRFLLRGGRDTVRGRSALAGLAMLRLRLIGEEMRLLGER